MTNGAKKTPLVIVWFMLGLMPAGFVDGSQIVWRRVPSSAQREAQQSARPLLIYVGAGFCGYCRELERTTWLDAGVAETIESSFVPLHVDGQRHGELARRLGVRGFPTVVVLSPDGHVLGQAYGYRGPEEMRAFLLRYALSSRVPVVVRP